MHRRASASPPASVPVIASKELSYDFEDLLGKGGFGVVMRGRWRGTNVAVKKLLAVSSKNDVKAFLEEAAIQYQCLHPNIVLLYGVVTDNSSSHCIVMELLAGSLRDLLKSDKLLVWSERLRLAQEMGAGLNYLHNQGILHCDLKSYNVLLDSSNHAKLSDFGHATHFENKQRARGTPGWAAPELHNIDSVCSFKSDVYSYGMTLWELASRTKPFAEMTRHQIIIHIQNGGRPKFPSNTPEQFSSIVSHCWETVPENRHELSDILKKLHCMPVPPITPAEYTEISFQKGIDFYLQANFNAAFDEFKSLPGYHPANLWIYLLYISRLLPVSVIDPAFISEVKNIIIQNIAWFQNAAKTKRDIALFNLGLCYELGLSVAYSELQAGECYKQAVEKNFAPAQFRLGLYFERNLEISDCYTNAYNAYQEAAKRGLAEAQYQLTLCCEKGIGPKCHAAEALKWLRKAAEQKLAKALWRLGRYYELGTGCHEPYPTLAFDHYQEAAAKELPEAQWCLGLCHEKGIGTSINLVEAIARYQQAANQGFAEAQLQLGICYESGIGVEQDQAKAITYYHQAASQKLPEARWRLGLYYKQTNSPDLLGLAADFFRQAAKQGFAKAQWDWGLCLENGIGIPQDRAAAIAQYDLAIFQGLATAHGLDTAQGLATAQFQLADCYYNGTNKPRNDVDASKAFNLYQQATMLKHSESRVRLGLCYLHGIGVRVYAETAVLHFRFVTENYQNSATGPLNLGICYEKGWGVAKDERKAKELYQQAADKGLAEAQFRLGLCHEKGIGTQKNLESARQCYQDAANQGYQKAIAKLNSSCVIL